MTPSVTYTGEEVALVAGFIALALPALGPADFDVADVLLDRALGALPGPVAPDLAARIEQLRRRPTIRMEDTDQ
jgi:hypothetical protein